MERRLESTLENTVFDKLKQRLDKTNLSVISAFQERSAKRNAYIPDIIIKKDNRIVAVIEVKSEIAFQNNPNYRVWLNKYIERMPINCRNALFAITDGERFLFIMSGSVEVITGFDFFVGLNNKYD